jgi:hypothetical protein
MARGISLHIGLNRVDPAHYQGWDGALTACEFDANDMRTIAETQAFEPRLLLTEEATSDGVLSAIEEAAGRLRGGDLFFCTYSGHGGQVADRNGDEKDRSDETWVAYDRQIVDDELYDRWSRFAPGVRILVLSDSCHSGTVTRRIDDPDVPDPVSTREKAAAESPRYRAMPRDVMIDTYRANAKLYDAIQERLPGTEHTDPAATALLISGCRDDQLSLDGFSNGLFTENLREVWAEGAWGGGGYAEFHEAIRARMPAKQQPNYLRVGADNPDFEKQKPFAIG